MAPPPLDRLPGFRRRFVITPGPGSVRSELEDDFHCMSVTLNHDAGVVTAVEPVMDRAPWTTCPGAVAQLKQTFAGLPLAGFASRGEKSANCTHLYDLASLAAAHAEDREPLIYDILVSDPIEGRRHAELRRNGVVVMSLVHEDHRIVAPTAIAGLTLETLRPWIDRLGPVEQEAARLLRWGAMMANGRTIPLEQQSDATRMPPNCYTFQPQKAAVAQRVGKIFDFSTGTAQPLGNRQAAARGQAAGA